ncbi:MAG: asparagine synthase (glutamine-hydrolyzing) [Bacteroidetes bacterium]|nr:asparagine synthase (glutamine-hydrolyzing) [Bacteroidota bacterium]
MCGIAGILDQTQPSSDNSRLLDQMLHIQHHRGPDDTGIWNDDHIFLGHNRLSIIDLTEAANQPMHYKNFTMVYNGEIYNYVEIKQLLLQKGHQFHTHSDSEVILHAYEEWGSACVNHFVGMWAFVIYNKTTKELFVSRDRFGIKPFYYIHTGSTFYFASEIKTLKASPHFKNDLNINQVARGLQMGWLGYNDETYFKYVKALPAACNLFYSDGKVKVEQYWKPETGKYANLSFDEKKTRFYELFADSIKIHLRSDVPVGSCLSGGLDSSAIVAMVQKISEGLPYKSFSIYYEGKGDVDERPFINEVLKKYPHVDPVYFSPTDDDVRNHFDKAAYHLDAPSSGSSFISQYFLMKLISESGIKVVLDGQGSDEYLAGYMHSFYRLIGGMLQKAKLADAITETFAVNKRIGNSGIKTISHFGKSMLSTMKHEQYLYDFEFKNYYPFLVSANIDDPAFQLDKVPGSKLDNFLYHLLFTTSLPSLLQYEDRNSMAFSVESRVPFLDHRLVEFAFTLADEDKIKQQDTKYILREALKPLLPEAIYARKDKKGFVTPGESKWLRGPLKHLVENHRKLPDFTDKSKVKQIFKDYKDGDNSKAVLVWRLAVLGEWL